MSATPLPMFVLISEYRKPIGEVEKLLEAHGEWVTANYESGRILVSGRREPPLGGLIVAAGKDLEEVRRWIQADPFVVHGVAEYDIHAFTATEFPKRSRAFDLFAGREGR